MLHQYVDVIVYSKVGKEQVPIIIRLKKWLIRFVAMILIVLLTLLLIRIYDSGQGKSLSLWHTVELHELTAKQIDQSSWTDYLQAEDALFVEVKQQITDQLDYKDNLLLNRYRAGSPVNPNQFTTNWNRSFILQPEGEPQGAVVLLHGLTDSPYTMRNLALHYQAKGFVVVCIRMPAHGTAPAALTSVEWQDWLAATRLAVRTATSYIKPEQSLHLVGYSNGGALALLYALNALSDDSLKQANQIVLIAPMIGVTPFAKFSSLAELPAIFPQFANTRWVDIIAEYNPFKYNSFPVNGARQSHRLTAALKETRDKTDNALLAQLPPILTFVSALDNTINNQATIDFYDSLTSNNNELVIFDINRSSTVYPLLGERSENATIRLLAGPVRSYNRLIVTNNETSKTRVERIDAGKADITITPLALDYPSDIYSLSHIALPYPETDSLYGNKPTTLNEFGISLGTLTVRGERQGLVTPLENLLRIAYNPFYPFLLEQIDQTINDTSNK